MGQQIAIEVHELTKRFGPVTAVDSLTFQVPRGTVTGFLGPNGAGKTTTLRMLLGLVTPTSGTATINGRPYRELADPLRHVGAALEAASFHPGRTAGNHLRMQAMGAGIDPGRVRAVLDLVDLTDAADRRVGGFSLGMRQRLGLAAALLGAPDVLILDEPANGLDPEGVRWLRDLLRALAAKGDTILVSSHVLAEVAQTVDSVLILDHGRLITHTSLTELTSKAHQVVRIRTPQVQRLRALLVAEGAHAQNADADWVELTDISLEKAGTLAAQHGIPVFEATASRANLEEIFFSLTAAPEGKDAVR
ncbi:MAG TPA: ATP-binding cassette domain-containing protein [Mycobacteriales bacterium]|nr:ATP-binding cassette domain-containing protein [Mycobacteriales bacterium]